MMLHPLETLVLYTACDTSQFTFETTASLEPLSEVIGQSRALEAVDFGASIKQDGFNLFAMGAYGSGKHTFIMNYLSNKVKVQPRLCDWCYVNNFDDPRQPVAISFDAGSGLEFKENVEETIDMLKRVLPSIFESDEYRNAKEQINQKYVDLQADIFRHLQEEAKAHNVALNNASSTRVTFAPIVEGRILSSEEFKALSGEKREAVEKNLNAFEAIVKAGLREVGKLNKAMQQEFMALDKEVTENSVETVFEELKAAYNDHEKITAYLNAMQADVIKNVQDFTAKPEEAGVPPFMSEYYTPSFRRYDVNLFISRKDEFHAPVVFEDNPTHQNLIGVIEHLSQVGTLVTDFKMIKPGALHKASGGYLVLDARKLLMQPFAYEELKRVLRAKEIRIESIAQQYALLSTATLEPEPIPVDVKVVLVGERMLYYMLYEYDPDFKELFKVVADFEEQMPRSAENERLYAQMIATIARDYELLPLNPEAVARVIEHGAREADHAFKLSTHLRSLADLLKEADYRAKQESCAVIGAAQIERALDLQQYRLDRVKSRLYEAIEEGTVAICVNGQAVGKINALSYLSLGGSRFGAPSLITARTRIGRGDIVDIERKVELSGPIHAKGVMILSSYLGSKYAHDMPLTLSASLVFEQTYAMIEGDSASSTELYALLSSLANLPIRQDLAVTGSVNQFGEVQAIGGVNEKIEGFFDICTMLDPEGSHGVLIPKTNVKHLMLKREVREAAETGKFAIYAVSTIDEGIELLTGVSAGEADAHGNYPEGTVNARVVDTLKGFTTAALKYHAREKEASERKEDT